MNEPHERAARVAGERLEVARGRSPDTVARIARHVSAWWETRRSASFYGERADHTALLIAFAVEVAPDLLADQVPEFDPRKRIEALERSMAEVVAGLRALEDGGLET